MSTQILMPSTKQSRLDALDADIARMEAEAGEQEGVSPTQSPEASEAPGSPESNEPGTAEQEVQPNEIKPKAQASIEPENKGEDDWKSRALVAEGRYNQTKAKLDSTIYQLRQENESLKDNLLTVRTELNKLRQSNQSSQTEDLSKLFDTKEVRDVLGKETTEILRKAVVETNKRLDENELTTEEQRIEGDRKELQTQAQKRYREFTDRLRNLVPTMDALNKDPNFIKYLYETDEASGLVKIDLLRQAEKGRDAARVAYFFNDYMKLAGLTVTSDTIVENKDSVNLRIAPNGTSNGGETPQGVAEEHGKQTFTEREVQAFYNDVARGKWKGRATEVKQMETAIEEAYASGNIIF